MCNDSSSCSRAVVGATIVGVVAGAASVALLNKTVREDIQSAVTDASEQINAKLTEAQKAINEAASGVKEKSRETLIAELKESQKRLKVAEKQLSSGKK